MMKTIDGVDCAEHGDVVRMQVHRGSYLSDDSIYEGGAWLEKEGVVLVLTDEAQPSPCIVRFFDGDTQGTYNLMDKKSWPDGPKTFLRKATPEEIRQANHSNGFRKMSATR
jgi:hypothetical protein